MEVLLFATHHNVLAKREDEWAPKLLKLVKTAGALD